MQRIARSRSDAPEFIVGPRDNVSSIVVIDCITVCTSVIYATGNIGITAIGARVTTIVGIVAAARRTMVANVAKR